MCVNTMPRGKETSNDLQRAIVDEPESGRGFKENNYKLYNVQCGVAREDYLRFII